MSGDDEQAARVAVDVPGDPPTAEVAADAVSEGARSAIERRRREGLERVRLACEQRGIVLDPDRLASLEPWVRGDMTLDEWYERTRVPGPDGDATGRVK